MEENNRKNRSEQERIIRKSLLKGQTMKVAKDNINLRENLKNIVRNFIQQDGTNEQKPLS
ncbi:MAG: hypothetical protein ACK40G_02755 [Cytophagaceae bacterium]